MQVVLASFYNSKKLRLKEFTAVEDEQTPEPRLCCQFLDFPLSTPVPSDSH